MIWHWIIKSICGNAEYWTESLFYTGNAKNIFIFVFPCSFLYNILGEQGTVSPKLGFVAFVQIGMSFSFLGEFDALKMEGREKAFKKLFFLPFLFGCCIIQNHL